MEELDSVLFVVPDAPTVAPVPGVIFVHTTDGLCLLHPGTLEPLEIRGLQDSNSGHQQTAGAEFHNPQIQFKGTEIVFNLVKVYDIEGCRKSQGEMEGGAEAPPTQQETLGDLDPQEGEDREHDARRKRLGGFDFGSCRVAFTVNDRLIILHVAHW